MPFILFALIMPFQGSGETLALGPVTLHVEGLWAGANIVAKATLGVLAAVLLSTTTTARELLRGLTILKFPTAMTQIASFMLRYINVVADEMHRMSVARKARGFSPSGIRDWKFLASTAGALFIRSFERGERVYLAMVSRGYTGTLPAEESSQVHLREWCTALALPGLALVSLISGRVVW